MKTVLSASAPSRRRTSLFLLGIVLIGANLRAPLTALGPVLTDIQASLALNDVSAGLLSSLPLVVFAIASLFVPAIGKKVGVERGLGIGLAVVFLGTVLRSSSLPFSLWTGTLMISGGIAVGNVLLPGLVKREFPSQAATLIGVYVASMVTTAGIASGVSAPLAHTPGLSWRVAIAAFAPLSVIALLVWTPQMVGTQHRSSREASRRADAVSPWKHLVGWYVSAFFVFQSLIFYSIIGWYSSIANWRGEDSTSAGFDLLLFQIVSVIASLVTGRLMRGQGDQRLLGLVCGITLLIGTSGLWISAPIPTIWLSLAGIGGGLSMTTCLSLFALRTGHHDDAAKLSGMAQFVGYLGAALGPVVFGFLHQVFSTWIYSLSLLVVASILVTIFAFLAGRDRFVVAPDRRKRVPSTV